MKKLLLSCLGLIFIFSFSYGKGYITTELIDEAQNSLKIAYEAKCEQFAPYEYSKARAYYEISKMETSKGNLKAGKAAALKSIEWSLKAISKRYKKGD